MGKFPNRLNNKKPNPQQVPEAAGINPASRLEGLTKTYDASLLASGPAFETMEDPGKYACRSLGESSGEGKESRWSVMM